MEVVVVVTGTVSLSELLTNKRVLSYQPYMDYTVAAIDPSEALKNLNASGHPAAVLFHQARDGDEREKLIELKSQEIACRTDTDTSWVRYKEAQGLLREHEKYVEAEEASYTSRIENLERKVGYASLLEIQVDGEHMDATV